MSQYEILEVLGRGGMGVVYKATDNVLHRPVAIKVFHENLVQQEVVIKRFLRESNISAQLDHPHIVKVYRFEKQAGKSFLVMEYIQGKPLLDYIKEQQLSVEAKLEILAKVASALHYAHRKNVIHRDIKPSNIMIRTNGDPVVMDFGIAKCVGLDEITRTGEFMGTIQYVSPEQAEGNRRELDHRTDVYSLGAVMYHLLVGKPPVEATTFNEMLYQLAYQNPTPPCKIHPEIPSAVEQICLKALAKEKIQRYASTQEFAEDIQNYLTGKKTKAIRWAKQQFWKRLLLRSAMIVGALLFLVVLGVGGYSYSQQKKIAEKKAIFEQKMQLFQTQLKKQTVWQIDELEQWRQATKNCQEIWDLYQQNREWLNDPKFTTDFLNHRAYCAYQLAIHEWVEDPLQSINSFSTVLDISLPEKEQLAKTQLAMLASHIHLQYLSHNYKEVCAYLPLLSKYFNKPDDLFRSYPEVVFLVAKSHYHCQQYAHAQKYFQVLRDQKYFMEHNRIKSEVFYYQGMCCYHNEQYHDALQNFQASKIARDAYHQPVDFGIHLLIYLADCQSQLMAYTQPLTPEQHQQWGQLLAEIEVEIDKIPPRSGERALYHEFKARHLLCSIHGQEPTPEQITQALENISQSYQILPCRYTQHLLRGIAFQYQGKNDFEKYQNALQEFDHASNLNPHQPYSMSFVIELSTKYLHYSRDHVSDFITQLNIWHTRTDKSATDFYRNRMKELELQCNEQLQKFIGIPYSKELVAKFYRDLESPVTSIRQLARSSLIDMVSYIDGLADHQATRDYLKEKLNQMGQGHPLYTTVEEILEEINVQAAKEASWQYLYLLARIPSRERIPSILLAECNSRPGMISFLMKMLKDHQGNMIPELQSSWPWLQYLAARVLVQLPYHMDEESAAIFAGPGASHPPYARQVLFEMITSTQKNQGLDPIFCLSVAKALKDARFLWWDRNLICQWVDKVWHTLKDQQHSEDMWKQTNIVSLLISETDKQARDLLSTMYKETKYDVVKAFIIHEIPKNEDHSLTELAIQDFYQWIPKRQEETPEITQLRALNILNTPSICSYISYKYASQKNNPKKEQEKDEEYQQLIRQLSYILANKEEDNKIQKAVMTMMLLTPELTNKWLMVNQNNHSLAHSMNQLVNASDHETRLLAIATTPMIVQSSSSQEFHQKALTPNQPLGEKIALFYGMFSGSSANKKLKMDQNELQMLLRIFSQLQDQHTQGWIFAILCHLRYLCEDRLRDPQMNSLIMGVISSKFLSFLNSTSHELLFWALVSTTRINEFSPAIYNKISTMYKEDKFPSPLLKMLALSVLVHLSMKYNLANDYRQWEKLVYEKLKNPQLRPYLTLFVWGYLQTMRNNEINSVLYGALLGREESIAIQDLYWLRYQKNLLDPQFHHYAETCLTATLQLFAQFADSLTILEKEQCHDIELMLAELYYRDGRTNLANEILERGQKHLEYISIAMLWAEHNPQRIHEIWPIWNMKAKQYSKDTKQATLSSAAMFMRMTAIKHQQENQSIQVIQDLQEAALLESGEAESWVLLFDALLNIAPERAFQLMHETHCAGFYQARIYWGWIRYFAKYAKYMKEKTRYDTIYSCLKYAAVYWEYPITFPMLQELGCDNIPSGEMCYLLAYNHTTNRWHYEACYWLKEAARLNYKIPPQFIQQDYQLFKKYKAKKYQVYDAQSAIKKLFESD